MATTIRLGPILKQAGTFSVAELCRKNNSPERSVFRQAQIAAIHSHYRQQGLHKSEFGFPLREVEFRGDTALQDYSAGRITFTSDGPQGTLQTVVRVRFLGFRCVKESASDQLSGSDEPYFIIGVASGSGSRTLRAGPFEGIDTGTVRFDATNIVSPDDRLTPPIVIGVVAMEHDAGSPEEAETKVRNIIKDVEKKLDQAVGAFSGGSTGNHVLPEFARDILIGWLPEGIAAIFGLGDDEIGKTPIVLFDNSAELMEWRAPAVIGKHGENEFNVIVHVDGGDEGKYDLFFLVDLFEPTVFVKKREPGPRP